MNRIRLSDTAVWESSSKSLSSIVQPADRPAPHALFGPLHYEPNYAYPLIVWLHGPGGSERDLRQTMPMISVTANPLIGPVPKPSSTTAAISVVMLASAMVPKAFS